MPAVSARQKRFFGAEMGRAEAGKATKTGMSESQLRDYVSQPIAHRPAARSGAPVCTMPGCGKKHAEHKGK